MKEAMGGVFTLQAIVFALIVIMCLMAFAVNYSKAFRVKNEIRSIIEKSEGLTLSAQDQINEMVRKHQYYLSDRYDTICRNLKYDIYNSTLDNGTGVKFCVKQNFANNMGEMNQNPDYRSAYYSVVTFVNIDVPIVNNLLPFTAELIKIRGETSLIYSNHHNEYSLAVIKYVEENYEEE